MALVPAGAPDSADLVTARDAAARHAWKEALENFKTAQLTAPLDPEDLDRLAEAAFFTGHIDECIVARERAYRRHVQASMPRRAAMSALELVRYAFLRQTHAVGNAWLAQAERLLADQPECVEHGYLMRMHCLLAFEVRRDHAAALPLAGQVLALGNRFGDRDLVALALQDQGRILIAESRVVEGMALLDEATVAAVSGDLGPLATAIVYCNMIASCHALADFRRASEWTEAATRWCERHVVAGFPGECRMYRATLLRLRGAWAEAEAEARRAHDELRGFRPGLLGMALYEVGLARLLSGDLTGAENAFREAHQAGNEPEPGRALLRLAQGRMDTAYASLRRALADEPQDRLARARLLPTHIQIALAAGDRSSARTSAAELEGIAADYGTSAFRAEAAAARGAVQLADGDSAAARLSLRLACRLWQELEMPYEVARARVLLGEASRAEGQLDAAALEFEAARVAFERMGAGPDVLRTTQLLRAAEAALCAVPTASVPRTFMFTDIVDSTRLVEVIGDLAWTDLLRWHDQILRGLFSAHGGEEIDHAGDGFFVAFEAPAAAIACAAAIQRTLAEHRRGHGFAPLLRVGLHAATAARGEDRGYRGHGVHLAARIAASAEGGQILASCETLKETMAGIVASAPRPLALKGVDAPVDVVVIDWTS